jgi:hypothetical protein
LRNERFVALEHVIHVLRASPCQQDFVKTTTMIVHAKRRVVSRVTFVSIESTKFLKIYTIRGFAANNARSTCNCPVVIVFRLDGSIHVDEVNDSAKFMPERKKK